MEEVLIKKMIKEISDGDYAKAKECLKNIVEQKVQERIRESMKED